MELSSSTCSPADRVLAHGDIEGFAGMQVGDSPVSRRGRPSIHVQMDRPGFSGVCSPGSGCSRGADLTVSRRLCVSRLAFDQGRDGGALPRADDQISLQCPICRRVSTMAGRSWIDGMFVDCFKSRGGTDSEVGRSPLCSHASHAASASTHLGSDRSVDRGVTQASVGSLHVSRRPRLRFRMRRASRQMWRRSPEPAGSPPSDRGAIPPNLLTTSRAVTILIRLSVRHA